MNTKKRKVEEDDEEKNCSTNNVWDETTGQFQVLTDILLSVDMPASKKLQYRKAKNMFYVKYDHLEPAPPIHRTPVGLFFKMSCSVYIYVIR